MLLSQDDLKQLATNIVSMLIADMTFEFPKVRATVLKSDVKQWNAFTDEKVEQVQEILLNKFGSSD